MEYKDIILKKEGHIAIIVMNVPEKMNALTAVMRQEIPVALTEISQDDNIRVLIFTGAGDRAFCAGADVGMMASRAAGELPKPTRRQITERVGWWPRLIRELRVPTIAAINGVAAGVGLSFAAACDIRIASDKSRFGAAWINRGLIPDGAATYLLPQILGVQNAFKLIYTGEIINAEEALRIGLVSQVVPHDNLMNAVGELAGKIAAGPPIAIELAKNAVYLGLETDIKTSIDFESYAQNVCRNTEDHKEGIMSFMEKRKAEFKGY